MFGDGLCFVGRVGRGGASGAVLDGAQCLAGFGKFRKSKGVLTFFVGLRVRFHGFGIHGVGFHGFGFHLENGTNVLVN